MEKTPSPSYRGGGDDPPDPLLPEDLLIQILVRLPIKSLLRFKSVCKSWRALIQTSFFNDLYTTFNSSFSSSSNFGTFILRTNTRSSVILMLSEYERGSESEYYGDQYRCTDGTWHRFTTDGVGDGDWLWNDTNHPLWYDANHPIWYVWYRVGQDLFKHDQEDWLWDDTKHRWYLVGDDLMDKYHLIHKYHQENLLWDDTNGRWYWVRDHQEGLLWDDTNGRWYWVHGDGGGGGDGNEEEEEEDHEVFKAANDDDDDDQLLLKVDKLELPSCYKLTSGRDIAGSCNGLICLYDQKPRDVSLWNPATGQFRTLPKSITDDDDDFVQKDDLVAFGFDVKTKDYKVLLITYFTSKSFCRAQVYSLRTDSWKEINYPLGRHAKRHGHGLYLNGCCLFITSDYHPVRRFIINSFDFTKETFTTMLPPDHDRRKHFFLRYLGGEKMALFTTLRMTSDGYEYDSDYSDDDAFGYVDCDIWVLNEQHGGNGDDVYKQENWTKLHSFHITNNSICQPIGMSNNGKFAFMATKSYWNINRIQLYNLATKEVKLNIPFCVSMSIVHVYNPSLVWISSRAIG